MPKTVIGIDVSKDTLDAYRLCDQAYKQFENTKTGFPALIAWLKATGIERVVYEPTGPHHRHFAAALHGAGIPLAPMTPFAAKRIGEGLGHLAKTDRIDAEKLARIGALTQPKIIVPPPPSALILKELKTAREALVRDRITAKNSGHFRDSRLLQRQAAQRLRLIERQLQALDAEIESRIQSDEILNRRYDILTSIPGVGWITAVNLLIDMPELGTLEAPNAASLAGLAPRSRSSGTWTGRAMVWGGRGRVRRMLYMPAVTAMRFNPSLRRIYDRLREAGKPAKVALVAVMRKLILLANALLRDDRLWQDTAPTH